MQGIIRELAYELSDISRRIFDSTKAGWYTLARSGKAYLAKHSRATTKSESPDIP